MIITQLDAFALQRADAIEQLTLALERLDQLDQLDQLVQLDQLDLDAPTLPHTLRTVGSIVSEGLARGKGKDGMLSPGAA